MSEKIKKSDFVKKTVKIGKRGQITLPKSIRTIEKITENEKLNIIKLPSGAMFIKKVIKETPEDNIIKIISSVKKIDFEKAWKEVQKEREMER